ncbi:MAG: hypothetical protein FWC79_07710 [Oscillospiraceae bacterium]|nr:hypothetical protein [Oscillospiraceae bacterium]
MNDGLITDNTTAALQPLTGHGGGVYVLEGTFNMHGGTISNNTTVYQGGGIRLQDGTFNMHAGTIIGNTAGFSAGGIELYHSTLNMIGAGTKTISENTATTLNGGGIHNIFGTFNTTNNTGDVIITNNTTGAHGGGFIMDTSSNSITIDERWTITGNTAAGQRWWNSFSRAKYYYKYGIR